MKTIEHKVNYFFCTCAREWFDQKNLLDEVNIKSKYTRVLAYVEILESFHWKSVFDRYLRTTIIFQLDV